MYDSGCGFYVLREWLVFPLCIYSYGMLFFLAGSFESMSLLKKKAVA